MKRVVPLLCLLSAAGIWAFALLAPKEPKLEPLPERLVGTFELIGFDPPKGKTLENPLPPGKEHLFRFVADGAYSMSVMLNEGYEILRVEGIAAVSGDELTLTAVSTNREEDRAPPERFHVEWGEDKTGPFLALRHLDHGYTFRLRRASP